MKAIFMKVTLMKATAEEREGVLVKAMAGVRAEVRGAARAEAMAKVRAEARAEATAKVRAEARAEAMAKVRAEARAEAMAKVRAEAGMKMLTVLLKITPADTWIRSTQIREKDPAGDIMMTVTVRSRKNHTKQRLLLCGKNIMKGNFVICV